MTEAFDVDDQLASLAEGHEPLGFAVVGGDIGTLAHEIIRLRLEVADLRARVEVLEFNLALPPETPQTMGPLDLD